MLYFNNFSIFVILFALIVTPNAYSVSDRISKSDSSVDAEDNLGYWKWFYTQRDNSNLINQNAYAKAVQTTHAIPHRFLFSSAANTFSTTSLNNNWQSVGPSAIGNSMNNYVSGRVSTVAIDPTNQNTFYLGSAQGGVWKSTDGGTTWTPLTDNQPSLAIGSITVDSSGNVYAGTGEGNLSCDSYYGAGILKSVNGGLAWTQLGASTFGSSTITKIVINPNNANLILASNGYGYTDSSTSACAFVNPGSTAGVYRSTDGGSTWSITLNPNASDVSDLVIDPSNSQTVYAAVPGIGIYKSTDGGMTWSQVSSPTSSTFGRISLGISSNVLFAAIYVNSGGQLFKSTDGGNSWTMISTPVGPSGGSFCESQCWYNIYVAPDPANSNILYLGGLDLYRTTNGGTTWTDLGGYIGNNNLHPDQHALAFNPGQHTTILVGNDGGVWSATNADTCLPISCWTDLNLGLTITQFQAISAAPNNANLFFGGTQDNGSPEHAGSSTVWSILDGGDGGWAAFDPSNPSTMYHTYSSISFARSDDGGQTWNDKLTGINQGDDAQFYVPVAMGLQHTSTLYLGTSKLYKTDNKGDNWYLPSPGLVLTSDRISTIATATSNDQDVYVGTASGKFYVSTNGGQIFTELDTGLPNKFLTKIGIDPSNPGNIYITYSGFGGQHVFFSSNFGNSWSDISSNLPDIPTNSILIKYGDIFVGTDIGPYVSTNSGSNWSRLGNGFPNVSIFDLTLTSDGNLLAATHGRGAWELGIACSPPSSGDWTVSSSCMLSSTATAPANVIVNSGVVLTIPNGFTLTVHFITNHVIIHSGGGVLVKSGGKLN